MSVTGQTQLLLVVYECLMTLLEHMQEQEIAWMSSGDESRLQWKELDVD